MSVVVITGASAGVGRATARRFARDGAKIGLIARDAERLERTAEEVRGLGGEALVLPLDVASGEAVDLAADRVEAELGPIDIWINSAMATIFAPLHEIRPEEYRRATEVTYLGTVHGTMAALKRMRQRDRGVIVQAGSALAYRAIPLQAPYCGAKHAIVGFTDALRAELIHDRSRINLTIVHLPAINTPQFDWSRNKMGRRPQPLPPIFQPEVAAEALHHAAFHPRREYWIGGMASLAILGQRVAPRLLDHYLAWTAYEEQQSDEPAEPGPGNLYEPVQGDHAAHGRFDDRAHSVSPDLWASQNRAALLGLGALLVVGGLGLLFGQRLMAEAAPLRRRLLRMSMPELPRIPVPDVGRIARRARPRRGIADLFRRS